MIFVSLVRSDTSLGEIGVDENIKVPYLAQFEIYEIDSEIENLFILQVANHGYFRIASKLLFSLRDSPKSMDLTISTHDDSKEFKDIQVYSYENSAPSNKILIENISELVNYGSFV
jgi:hypothetical protein